MKIEPGPGKPAPRSDPTGEGSPATHTDVDILAEVDAIVRGLSQFASAGSQPWKASQSLAENRRRKDDLLATLAHELRNPLAAIVTAASVLQERTAADDRATHAIDVIVRQSHHVSRLIDDLLDIARIERGKLQLVKRTVDLRTVVAETIETRRPQIERRRQRLTIELGAEPVWVDADPVRLAQAVSNLVDNAAKYTPENGRMSVTVSFEGDHAIVAVSDSGVGVPAERAESIFEAFTQLPESRESCAGGLGLGLALVRKLTELHGGTVDVVSAGKDQGSCFTLRLPMRRPANQIGSAVRETHSL
jgi:signal transduction histidine kinase